MKVKLSFSDLSHKDHFCNATPYAASLVAAYATKQFGDVIETELFKRPENLIPFFEQTPPKIACFSNYIWNTNLSYSIAKEFKNHNPESIVIFGGPAYSSDIDEQKDFLFSHPLIWE